MTEGLHVEEVHLTARDPGDLAEVVAPEDLARMLARAHGLAAALGGASVVNVNSTSSGGGVAEMLDSLLPYVRGAGIDGRWLVIQGDPDFFTITKRLHNHLYGTEGDGGPLGPAEQDHYAEVLRANAAELATAVRPGDVVILHDPQTAGLADALHRGGARVVWRCHIGIDHPDAHSELGWAFLRPHLEGTGIARFVFSRRAFAPDWLADDAVRVIPPSIDPFSPKNHPLSEEETLGVLADTGIIAGATGRATYPRRDGSRGRIEHGCDIVRTGPPPTADTPLVVQISRWDRLKDMAGVMRGFAEYVVTNQDAQLVLAGPVVTAVADDPEGVDVLRECRDAWQALPHGARRRIQLACIPMADTEENATIVNALQRHAFVVVQKSLAEGFGLTVSEAMYKGRPVIASAVGGIADQVVDGETGTLLDDATDLRGFATAVEALVGDPRLAAELGARGHARVVARFLPDSHLGLWVDLVAEVLDQPHRLGSPPAG